MTRESVSHYKDKTVAITGASGYLASGLIEVMRKAPVHILRISRKDLQPISGTETVKGDIRTIKCWEEIVSRADVIFHLAGNTSVYAAAKDPAGSLSSTVLPVTHLVAAAQATARRPRVVFASTATVYGLTVEFPVAEDVDPRPITRYDLHKLFAEKELELASNRGTLEGVSLRLANVYGPSASRSSTPERGILNYIAKSAIAGANLTLYGDGNYLRDYVYVDDVARAFLIAGVESGLAGRSFNVASGRSITVREAFHLVAERAERVTGKRVHVENAPWPENADPIEFRNFAADITSFQESTGWHPSVSLDQGIDWMIAYYLNKTGQAEVK